LGEGFDSSFGELAEEEFGEHYGFQSGAG